MTDVAITGIACRLPRASTPEEFFRLQLSGESTIRTPPQGRGLTSEAAYLDEIELFEPAAFGISPREAGLMDPHQRMALELVGRALDDAAIDVGEPRGADVGVWASCMVGSWEKMVSHRVDDPFFLTGTQRSMVANGVSRRLGLNGPSMVVDSGQSSSLVAVYSAVRALEAGECSVAVAGGVNLILDEASSRAAASFGALSKTSRSLPFDERADGYVRGEGGVFFVLRPLDTAVAAGDRIYAVIRGGGVSNDGPGAAVGVPHADGQEQCIRDALADAGIGPDDLDYLELHGTGTRVGDPVEAAALGRVFGRRGLPLPIGSAKATVGHLESAAGVTGLLRVVLALFHRTVPPQTNFINPNPDLALEARALEVLADPQELPVTALAGVSSFGMGGTNCHLVVESAPAVAGSPPRPAAQDQDSARHVWLLSGTGERALADEAGQVLALLDPAVTSDADLTEIGRHLAARSSRWGRYRAVVTAVDRDGLTRGLEAVADKRPGEGVTSGRVVVGGLAGVFSGQGAQRLHMGTSLSRRYGVFGETFGELLGAMSDHAGHDLAGVIDGDDEDLLARTRFTQPALVAFEVAAHALVESWGVIPDVLVGHSIGELSAAHVAGVLDVDDLARLAVARGEVMDRLPAGGAMLAIGCTESEARTLLAELGTGSVDVAGVNSPTSTVVAGPVSEVELVEAALPGQWRRSRLRVSHAFHSPLMEPALEPFAEIADGVRHRRARTPVISNVDGSLRSEFDSGYWVRHLRGTVRFADGVQAAASEGAVRFLELGPRASLISAITETTGLRAVPLIGRPEADEAEEALRAVTELYVTGQRVSWTSVLGRPRAGAIPVPERTLRGSRLWAPDEVAPVPGDPRPT
ncbi:type I polyketide synthase, partial [Dietzia sp. B19]